MFNSILIPIVNMEKREIKAEYIKIRWQHRRIVGKARRAGARNDRIRQMVGTNTVQIKKERKKQHSWYGLKI